MLDLIFSSWLFDNFLLVNVVHFINSLIDKLSQVLQKVGQFKELRELDVNGQRLEQEHNALNIEHLWQRLRIKGPSCRTKRLKGILFVWSQIYFSKFIIDDCLKLEHFGIISC